MRGNKFMRSMDKLGRMVIPRDIRSDLKIKQDDRIEFFIDGENLVLKKYSPHQTCFITGEKLATNSELAPGLILSPKGAELLMLKLKQWNIRF